MRKWVVLFLLVFIAACFGSEVQQVSISDFAYGLFTADRSERIPLGAATEAHNLDLTTNFNAITKREGYKNVVTFRGHDSTLWNGLREYTQRNGDMRLVATLDSTGVGYANVFASEINSPFFSLTDTIAIIPDTNHASPFYVAISFNTGCSPSKCPTTGSLLLGPFAVGSSRAVVVDSLYDTLTAITFCDLNLSFADRVDTLLVWGDTGISGEPCNPSVSAVLNYDWYVFGGSATSRIYTRFAATRPPRYAQFNDWLFMASGVSKTIAYSGHHVTEFPKSAPGEVQTIPLLDNTGDMPRGEYHYALRLLSVNGTTMYDTTGEQIYKSQVSMIGTKVVAQDQSILLFDFPIPPHTALSTVDSCTYEIWRTTGAVGVWDKQDTLWNTSLTASCTTGTFQTVTVTDTLSDDQLRALGNGTRRILHDTYYTLRLDTIDDTNSLNGVGALYAETYIIPGAPGFISADSLTGGTDNNGIWDYEAGSDDRLNWQTVAGFLWHIVAVDTFMNSPSDSGWSFVLLQPQTKLALWAYGASGFWNPDSGNVSPPGKRHSAGFSRLETEKIRLSMPQTTDTDVTYQVYRTPIFAIEVDTVHRFTGDRWTTRRIGYRGSKFAIYESFYIGDFAPGDTITDTLPYDSLQLRPIYTRNAVPDVMSDIIAYDNRLIVSDGDFVYIGDVFDTVWHYDLFRRLAFDPDDGQQITGLFPEREVVKVTKTTRSYNMYKLNDTIWDAIELSSHYGIVNSLTHAASPEGDYFLSHDQVRRENEGAFKSRSFVGDVVSSQIASFRDMPLAIKQKTYGFYHDDKYVISVPSYDTAYVLNKSYSPDGTPIFGWTTWDLVPTATASFASVENVELAVGDTLYFCLSGDSSIYLFGGSGIDGETEIVWSWESGRLNNLDGSYYSPLSVGVMVEAPIDTVESIIISWEDDRDSTNSVQQDLIQRADTARLHFFDIAAPDPGWTWKVKLSYAGFNRGDVPPTTQQFIDGIIMEFVRHGRIKSQ